jgi:Ion channel
MCIEPLAKVTDAVFKAKQWFPLLSLLGGVLMVDAKASAVRAGYVASAAKVGAGHLYAALSAYLLAGIYFGLLYWVLEQIIPGTFTASTHFSQTSAIYFSFVTLATIGYGDITPLGDIARGHCHHRRRWRPTIPGSFGRKACQPVSEACRQLDWSFEHRTDIRCKVLS